MTTLDDDLMHECSECGHLHYFYAMRIYEPCPLAGEGCPCPFAQGDARPEVYELRARLEAENILWMHVRTYPHATFLPAKLYTVWYIEADEIFLWGHSFEYRDKTPDDVITRLKELAHVH